MAYQSIWYYTDIPNDIIDIIERDLSISHDCELQESKVGDSKSGGDVVKSRRNSKHSWINTNHWISGFLWHYVQKANRENFLYDISNIDAETLQYTVYSEGEYYNWHTDVGIASLYKPVSEGKSGCDGELATDFLNQNCEKVRKLSFSLLLSDPDTYEGGNFQIMEEGGKSYITPRKRGVIVLFDSRANHRVIKVTKGVRKSIVGWCVGPRWK